MKKFIFVVLLLISSTSVYADHRAALLTMVEQYYLLEAEGDYESISQIFQSGGKVSYVLDFGVLMPDYEIEFVVKDASSFKVLIDEEDDSVMSNIQWDIVTAESDAGSGKVVVKLSWDYTSSSGDGSASATDTFQFVISDSGTKDTDSKNSDIKISSYHSEQQY